MNKETEENITSELPLNSVPENNMTVNSLDHQDSSMSDTLILELTSLASDQNQIEKVPLNIEILNVAIDDSHSNPTHTVQQNSEFLNKEITSVNPTEIEQILEIMHLAINSLDPNQSQEISKIPAEILYSFADTVHSEDDKSPETEEVLQNLDMLSGSDMDQSENVIRKFFFPSECIIKENLVCEK